MNQNLQTLIKNYYESYYRDALGLKDWKQRIDNFRLNEEVLIGDKLERFASMAGISLEASNILIVGCGTGAELFYFASRSGAFVSGIDPFDDAINICRLKAEIKQLKNVSISKGEGEKLLFQDGSFDLIICFTVLEHVANVDDTLREIVRVMKPSGKALIVLPNYSYPEEPHYKIITFPPAYFPLLVRFHLHLLGRTSKFFKSLNLLTRRSLSKKIRATGISYKFFRQYTYRAKIPYAIKLYCWFFRVDRNLIFVLTK